MTRIIENDVMLSKTKKNYVPLPKKWQESKKMMLLKKNDMNHGKWHYSK